MMIYTCKKCRFMFEGKGYVEHCPDCGSDELRSATKAEQAEYRMYQEEFNMEMENQTA